MSTIVVYASKHGTAKQYAEYFAKRANLEVKSYKELKKCQMNEVDAVIFFASVYYNKAGGVKELVKYTSPETKISFISIGVSGYDDVALQASLQKQMKNYFKNINYYHLRGQVDKVNLNLVERLIINMVAKSKFKAGNGNLDFQKVFEHDKTSFVDFDKLDYIMNHM